MRENRTSGLTSGDGKRSGLSVVTAPVLDSTALKLMSAQDARGPMTQFFFIPSIRADTLWRIIAS
jgi:hypothetical protein